MTRNLVRNWFRRALAAQLHLPDLPDQDGSRLMNQMVVGERFAEVPIYLITPDVATVLRAAADGWKDEPLMAEDLGEHQEGFAYFPEPVLYDGGELALHIEAVAWMPSTIPGADMHYVSIVNVEKYGRMLLSSFVAYGTEEETMSGAPLLRVLWRFLQQTIAVSAVPMRGHVDGPTRQARPIETLRIVTLRHTRSQSSGEGDGTREYSHRWLVRGFWRNTWFASQQVHRQQWIAEHVAGPEDKPLVVKDTVYLVKR